MRSWPLIAVLLTASWTICYAAPPQAPASSPVEKARLAKGARAPFDGVLLTDAALARILTGYERQIAGLEARLEKRARDADAHAAAADAVCTSKVKACEAMAAIAAGSWDRERAIYDNALKRQADPPWYKSNHVNFILGSLLGGGICVAAYQIGGR